jgi:hypothetical protein
MNRRFGGTYRIHLQGRKIRERGTTVNRWLEAFFVKLGMYVMAPEHLNGVLHKSLPSIYVSVYLPLSTFESLHKSWYVYHEN